MRNIKIIFVIILTLFIATKSFALNSKHCKDEVIIDVHGMVCDFCARAIEKVFSKKDEVSSIDVNLDDSKIIIIMKDGKTIDNAELKKLIIDSGYDVVRINNNCSE